MPETRSDTLQLLFENNERALDLLGQCMAEPMEEPEDSTRAFMRRIREAWNAADAATLNRLAHFPALLLDIRGWDAPADTWARGFFPEASAVSLMRSTLTLAWHVCRTSPHTAALLLGLPPASLAPLRALRIQDLDPLALTRAHCLRPRWLATPWVWTELLVAARADTHAFEESSLHALQQMIGELLPAHVSP